MVPFRYQGDPRTWRAIREGPATPEQTRGFDNESLHRPRNSLPLRFRVEPPDTTSFHTRLPRLRQRIFAGRDRVLPPVSPAVFSGQTASMLWPTVSGVWNATIVSNSSPKPSTSMRMFLAVLGFAGPHLVLKNYRWRGTRPPPITDYLAIV